MKYNWQQADWPDFKYSLASVQDQLFQISEKVGRVSGVMDALPEDTQMDMVVDIMLAEAIKTSEIEGEFPNRKDVLSSIRKNLGLQPKTETIKDKSAEGLGELMIDVRKSFMEPLTRERLFR